MGPLTGVKVVEIAGLAPAPFCGMILADMGADVLLVNRPGGPQRDKFEVLQANRPSTIIDLKSPDGVARMLRLVEGADALIEGFRPGVMERLGVGPADCMSINPKLVYGRVTGWGQDGPLASTVGHDGNYLALSGAFDAIGERGQPPLAPLNLLGDYAGGGMLLALGIASALYESTRSGRGQIVDAAMLDGVTMLMSRIYGRAAKGTWSLERGANPPTGTPWYAVYETSDQRYVSVCPIEDRFYASLISLMGLADADLPPREDVERWPELRGILAERFRSKTRDEWCAILEGTDACFAPVLDVHDALVHPHNRARELFVEIDGVTQPSPAPRFSRTVTSKRAYDPSNREQVEAASKRWCLPEDEIS